MKKSKMMNNEILLYLLETSDDVVKALQKRRKNGGCSAWRTIGLKWVSDNNRYDLLKYDWEWDYIKKHYKSLNEDDRPKKLKTDIPDNPFDEVEDDKDKYESSELTYKQNLKFRKYLDRLGYTDFSEWWDKIGKSKMDEMYTEEISMNFKEGDILQHWDIWIQNNMDRILD